MRRLIVYGSCQAQELGRILAASPNVRECYDVRVHWVGEQFENTDAWAAEIAQADLVFVQSIPEWQSYPLWHWNQDRARFITYPYLTLSAVWPFDTARGVVDPVAVAAQAEGRGCAFQFQDRLLALMRAHIPDPDERFDAYRTLSDAGRPAVAAFLDELDLVARFADRSAAFGRRDATHGLGIGAAVTAQCRAVPLFHTVTHPTAGLLRRLGGELMGKVGVFLEPQSSLSDGFDHYQVPVHPVVAETLGIAWAGEGRRWRFGGEDVTFETYYRRYIETFG